MVMMRNTLSSAVYGQNLTTPDGKCKLSGMLLELMLAVTKIYLIRWNGSAKYSGSMIVDYTNTLLMEWNFRKC